MAELLSGMPVMPLLPGMRVQFEAIDILTGAAVSGVTVSLAAIYAVDSEDSTVAVGDSGPFMLVPGPVPVE